MFEQVFFRTEWSELSVAAWTLLGVAAFFWLLNIAMRIIETAALRKRYRWEDDKKRRYDNPSEGISVIVTVSNSAEAIGRNLPALLEQDYPDFEVIVVDEVSDDASLDILTRMADKYPRLRISRLYPGNKFRRTKKIALNIGILAAKNDILLFTDIDCVPVSRTWIREMQACFSPEVTAVLGSSILAPDTGKTDMCRFVHNIHMLKRTVLYMFGIAEGCDPANYAYRKSLYLEEHGFTRNNHEVIGYEREIVMKLQKKGKVRMNRCPSSFVEYRTDRETKRLETDYYYAEKRYWKFPVRILADLPQWIHCFLYLSLFSLFFMKVPLWLLVFIVLETFFTDLIFINLQMGYILQRKLFITSLLANTTGFISRWYHDVNSIFTGQRWR